MGASGIGGGTARRGEERTSSARTKIKAAYRLTATPHCRQSHHDAQMLDWSGAL
jgi:hypothetical protein